MPEEPSKRGEMTSHSSVEARDRITMEARFSAQKKEYESCIAREKWQVKYDAQTSNGMGVGGETLKGHALCILETIFFNLPPPV